VAAVLACAALASCLARTSFDGAVFRGRDVSFRVPPTPASWRRVELAAADLAFRDDPHEGSVLLNSRCATADRDAPLASLTQHLIMGTTARQVRLEETVPFDGREARHTVLEAQLDGVPMAYDIYVLKKDGCVFDLVYVAPPRPPGAGAGGDPGTAAFDAFVKGFHTVASAR
jgi:hypothetical protein